jgi:hypothetical protein
MLIRLSDWDGCHAMLDGGMCNVLEQDEVSLCCTARLCCLLLVIAVEGRASVGVPDCLLRSHALPSYFLHPNAPRTRAPPKHLLIKSPFF